MKQVLAVQHDNTIAEIPSPDQVLKKFSGYIVNTDFVRRQFLINRIGLERASDLSGKVYDVTAETVQILVSRIEVDVHRSQTVVQSNGYSELGQLVLFVKCDSMISNEETAFSCCQTTPTADPKVWAVFRFTGGSDPVLSQNGMITDSIHAVTGSRITQRRERVQVRWPVLLVPSDGGTIISTATENLSSSGFYCFSRRAFMPGEEIEARIEIPLRPTPTGNQRKGFLICRVRVVRLEPGVIRGYGLGCRIEDYSVLNA